MAGDERPDMDPRPQEKSRSARRALLLVPALLALAAWQWAAPWAESATDRRFATAMAIVFVLLVIRQLQGERGIPSA